MATLHSAGVWRRLLRWLLPVLGVPVLAVLVLWRLTDVPRADPGWLWRLEAASALTPQQALASLQDEPAAWQRLVTPPLLGYGPRVLWLARPNLPTQDAALAAAGPGGTWSVPRVLEVQPAYLDEVMVSYQQEGRWVSQRSGRAVPVSQRQVASRTPAVLVPPHIDGPLLVRVRTSSTLTASPRLWEGNTFSADKRGDMLLLGLIFGLLVTLLLLSLVQWATLGEASAGWFATYVLASGANWFGILGLASVYVLPETPLLAMRWSGVATGLAMAAGHLFYDRFLGLRGIHPALSRTYQAMAGVGLLCALAVALGQGRWIAPVMPVAMLISINVAFWPIARLLRQPGRIAHWIALTYLLHNAMLAVNLLAVLGLGTLGLPVAVALQGGLWALLCQLGVLHLALGQRMQRALSDAAAAREQTRALESKARLERDRAADQERFLAILSHELRTPVAILGAALSALRSAQGEDANFRRERYAKIGRALRRMQELIDLGFAHDRLASERLDLQREPIAIADLAEAVLDDLPAAGAARVRLPVAAPACTVQADWTLWRISVLNLVDNALKYAPARSPVDLSWGRDAQGFWLCVDDQGEGVPEVDRELIFNKYRRGDLAQPVAGLGLGLFLARRIVQAHGGSLVCETAPGGGCRMRLLLPDNALRDSSSLEAPKHASLAG